MIKDWKVKMATSLEEMKVMQVAESLADDVWKQVIGWNNFAKDTVGKQFTRAVDSIGANTAESFGRFHYSEKINFLYYSRGSVFESKYWLNRCHKRNLVGADVFKSYSTQLTEIARQINGFASHLKSQRSHSSNTKAVREEQAEYVVDQPVFTETDFAFLNL
jgi:four helix bundle protein